MLEQFADLAGKKVHVEKRSLVGAQIEAFGAAVRQDDVHLLAIAVSALPAASCGTHSARSLLRQRCMLLLGPVCGVHNHNRVTIEFL